MATTMVYGDLIQVATGLSAFSGGGAVFIQPGDSLPDPIAANTIYIDLNDNTLTYALDSELAFCVPLSGTTKGPEDVLYHTQSSSVDTTTSTAFQDKIIWDPLDEGVPAGQYIAIFAYGWNHDDTGSDFEAQFTQTVGLTQLGEIQKEESQDAGGAFGATGTDQRKLAVAFRLVNLVDAASDQLRIRFRTSTAGVESSMWDAHIILIPVTSTSGT